MTCVPVRSRLTERSLGALTVKEQAEVDRHLAWCAACRKESNELDAAAASLVYALAPQEPSPELEEQVVAAVQRAGTGGRTATHRRGRMVIAATVAAMMAVAGLGFGAVMAGRAARFRDQAITSSVQNRGAQAAFRQLLSSMEFSDPRNSVEMGDLVAVGGGSASGTATTLLAPSSQDLAIVTVSSLRLDPRRLPLQVYLMGQRRKLLVGSITNLDSGGSAHVAAQMDADLSFFDQVVVRDANGTVVLRGDLRMRALQSQSPSPSP